MKFKLRPKITLGSALTMFLLLISGLLGLYSVARLSAAFDYLTGGGWETANSPKEGWHEIQALI